MPWASERAAQLYYDDACGPCTFFAHAAEGLSRHQVEAVPLASPLAERAIGHLSPEARYGAAHLLVGQRLETAESIATPLLGLTLGPVWERIVRSAPPLGRWLGKAYLLAWTYRRQHGCGAAGSR